MVHDLLMFMPAYRTPEYLHLLAAERAIALAMEPKPDQAGNMIYPDCKDIASLASALTRVVDQKRIMRGQPAPKPADGRQSRGSRRPARAAAPCHAEPSAPAPAPASDSSV